METVRPSKPRLLLFAFGDFAFNIYWQSVMLFLLFYYTDALDIPIGVAATTYMIASVWDGIASFAAGVLVDRRHGSLRAGLVFTWAAPRTFAGPLQPWTITAICFHHGL